MTYAGLPVASASLSIEPDRDAARSELVIREEGVAAVFGRSVTRMQAVSRIGGAPTPRQFEARYEKPDRTREAVVHWDGRGRVVHAVEVKGGRERPSEVPAAQQDGTVDPLTALLKLRDWLAAADTDVGETTSVAVFDGRKRFDFEVRRMEDQVTAERRLPRLQARIVPIFGFDQDDTFVSWPDQPPRWFDVVVSGDGRYAPLTIGEQGRPMIIATHDCMSAEDCQSVPEP
jgi:hypothetical protein